MICICVKTNKLETKLMHRNEVYFSDLKITTTAAAVAVNDNDDA